MVVGSIIKIYIRTPVFLTNQRMALSGRGDDRGNGG